MRKADTVPKLDDYSQPSDRVLASNRTVLAHDKLLDSVKPIASGRQSSLDYTEPYLEQNLAIPPDPEGIYAFAKDVEDLQQLQTQQAQSLIHAHKLTYMCQHTDLVPNYEEPWDTEEGQQKLNSLMIKAEKKDIKRQSIDKISEKVIPKVEVMPVQPRATKSISASVYNDSEVYETSWKVNSQKHSQSNDRFSENIHLRTDKSPNLEKSHNSLPSCYEDAWDLPSQQRALEIKLEKLKLEQARKDFNNKGLGSVPELKDNTTALSPQMPPLSSPNRPTTAPDHGFKSDSFSMASSEKIDATIPLEEQIFYHGAKKRLTAERNLLLFKEGSYLIRRSETSKDDYSLTLKGLNGAPMHIKIAHKPDGTFILGQNSPPFASIPEMVDYYTKHELPVQNADRICLMYPIPN